jgi:CheY-like chemotaxis protein
MSSIHEMIEAERLKLGSHVEVKYNPEAINEKIEVYTDKGKLIQILLNLLKNALKFTKEGTIEYGYQKVDESKNNIRFFVKDTGIGIADDKHEVIFNIFRQVDETLTRNYGGTGIGLFVVKKYTELLGGEVELISKEGKGSIFYVTLPVLNSTSKKEPEIMESDNSALRGKTVLVVEDDEFSASFLIEVLKGMNIRNYLAQNGKEAIQICENNSTIDLVLMDLTMPEMDGYEATRLLKEKDPELIIIAQTAHAIPGDKEKTLQAGFDDYISKPILLSELNQILNRYLNN